MSVVGIDLAQRADRTAIATLDGWKLTRLEIIPPPIEFDQLVAHLHPIIAASERVFMDASGMGDPITSHLAPQYPQLKGVRITPGNQVRQGDPYLICGKGVLIKSLLQSLTRKKLRIVIDGPERELLRRELLHFERTHLGRGSFRYEAAGSGHDDAVIAVALAVIGRLLPTK